MLRAASSTPERWCFNSFHFDGFAGVVPGSLNGQHAWLSPSLAAAPIQVYANGWTTLPNNDSDGEQTNAMNTLDLTKPFVVELGFFFLAGYTNAAGGDPPDIESGFAFDDVNSMAWTVQWGDAVTQPNQLALRIDDWVGASSTPLMPVTPGIRHNAEFHVNRTHVDAYLDGVLVGSFTCADAAGMSNKEFFLCLYGKPNPLNILATELNINGTHT